MNANKCVYIDIYVYMRPVVAQGHKVWVRSPLEEMKYLPKFIIPFLRSGVEVLPLNSKVGNGVS